MESSQDFEGEGSQRFLGGRDIHFVSRGVSRKTQALRRFHCFNFISVQRPYCLNYYSFITDFIRQIPPFYFSSNYFGSS